MAIGLTKAEILKMLADKDLTPEIVADIIEQNNKKIEEFIAEQFAERSKMFSDALRHQPITIT